jgi:hypothetical protein
VEPTCRVEPLAQVSRVTPGRRCRRVLRRCRARGRFPLHFRASMPSRSDEVPLPLALFKSERWPLRCRSMTPAAGSLNGAFQTEPSEMQKQSLSRRPRGRLSLHFRAPHADWSWLQRIRFPDVSSNRSWAYTGENLISPLASKKIVPGIVPQTLTKGTDYDLTSKLNIKTKI